MNLQTHSDSSSYVKQAEHAFHGTDCDYSCILKLKNDDASSKNFKSYTETVSQYNGGVEDHDSQTTFDAPVLNILTQF